MSSAVMPCVIYTYIIFMRVCVCVCVCITYIDICSI